MCALEKEIKQRETYFIQTITYETRNFEAIEIIFENKRQGGWESGAA